MAVLTVCSSGCDHTTVAAAIAAAGATDIIEIQESIDETVSLSKNIAEIRGTSTAIIWSHSSNTGGQVLSIQSGLTQAFLIRDITIQQNNNGVGIRWSGIGSGSSVECRDMKFNQTGGLDALRVTSTMTTVDQLFVQRCEFIGGAGSDAGIRIQAANSANTVRVQNCTFRDLIFGFRLDDTSTTSRTNIYNCTIENCGTGLQTNNRGDYKNNLFINNTSDINFLGSSDVVDLVNNAFEEQTDTGGFGANNIFGITSTDEVVDEVNHDFHLKSGSQSREAGFDLSGVFTDDFNGTTRPQETNFDIGALEFIPSVTGGPNIGSLPMMGIGR